MSDSYASTIRSMEDYLDMLEILGRHDDAKGLMEEWGWENKGLDGKGQMNKSRRGRKSVTKRKRTGVEDGLGWRVPSQNNAIPKQIIVKLRISNAGDWSASGIFGK